MKHRAASRAVSRIATPKNCAASRGVFIIPRKRDKKDAGKKHEAFVSMVRRPWSIVSI
jgi:hypothetical protein